MFHRFPVRTLVACALLVWMFSIPASTATVVACRTAKRFQGALQDLYRARLNSSNGVLARARHGTGELTQCA